MKRHGWEGGYSGPIAHPRVLRVCDGRQAHGCRCHFVFRAMHHIEQPVP